MSHPPAAARPTVTGIHHVGITVADVEASAAWYERVLGFRRQFIEKHHRSDGGGYTIVLGPDGLAFSIGVDHHPGHGGERFDPARTGLDHLSFGVASPDDLHEWVRHLDALGVANSGVYAMAGFPVSLLTFCDPDGVQLELIAFHA